MNRFLSQSAADEDGVTLVELIVAIVVSALFGGMLAMLFVNGWTAQEKSVARDTATGNANVLSLTMAESVRNSISIRVSNSGTRLDAVVAKPNASLSTWEWECRAWAVIDQSIRYSVGDTARSVDATPWKVLAGKSSQRPNDKVAAAGGATPFTLVGSRGVQLAVDITIGDEQKTVTLSNGMTAQAVATTGAIACW